MSKVLKSLLPKGHPWRLPETHRALIEAMSLSLDRARDFLSDVTTESNPGTAEETLQSWYADLGLKYDDTQGTAGLQQRARQAQTSIGGQDKTYLEGQIQIAFPDITLEEVELETEFMIGVFMVGRDMVMDYPSWLTSPPTDGSTPGFYYRVTGEVETVQDLLGLKNILEHIAPLHMEPVYDVTVLQVTDTAQCGLAITGLAEVGKEVGE